METVLVLTGLLLFAVSVVGLIAPRWVFRWLPAERRTRGKAFLTFLGSITVSIISQMFVPPEERARREAEHAARLAREEAEEKIKDESRTEVASQKAAPDPDAIEPALGTENSAQAKSQIEAPQGSVEAADATLSRPISDPTLEQYRVAALQEGCPVTTWIFDERRSPLSTLQQKELANALDDVEVTWQHMIFTNADDTMFGDGANADFVCASPWPQKGRLTDLRVRVSVSKEFKPSMIGLQRGQEYVLRGRLQVGHGLGGGGMYLRLTANPIRPDVDGATAYDAAAGSSDGEPKEAGSDLRRSPALSAKIKEAPTAMAAKHAPPVKKSTAQHEMLVDRYLACKRLKGFDGSVPRSGACILKTNEECYPVHGKDRCSKAAFEALDRADKLKAAGKLHD